MESKLLVAFVIGTVIFQKFCNVLYTTYSGMILKKIESLLVGKNSVTEQNYHDLKDGFRFSLLSATASSVMKCNIHNSNIHYNILNTGIRTSMENTENQASTIKRMARLFLSDMSVFYGKF